MNGNITIQLIIDSLNEINHVEKRKLNESCRLSPLMAFYATLNINIRVSESMNRATR